MNNITAIETRYAGCRFRSRLEARWAVFFNACGIRWEYEPQGFIGFEGDHYLPDFYLPDAFSPSLPNRGYEPFNERGIYVEVKGSDEQLRADWHKIAWCIEYRATPCATGLLLLGPIPNEPVVWPIAYWNKGIGYDYVDVSNLTNGEKYSCCMPHIAGTCTTNFPTLNEDDRPLSIEKHKYIVKNPANRDANRIARSARFEHGEEG